MQVFGGFKWWIGIGVFLLSTLDNGLSALYTIKTVQRSPFWSGFLGSKIDLIGSLSVVAYTQEAAYIIPMYLGSFVGSYGAVYWKKKLEKRQRRRILRENQARAKIKKAQENNGNIKEN